MPGNPPLDVQKYGQSIWYDNISRDLIESGELQKLIDEYGVVGVTSNPTIFEKTIGHGTAYDESIRQDLDLAPDVIFDRLAIADIQHAADILRPVFERTNGLDGYISLEVSPLYANDTESTIREAKRLFETVNRPNLMVKIPGTAAGLPAIEEALFAGVNINVTLLFAVENYVQVAERYIRALERRLEAGLPIDRIASVASFFLSRIDNLVDKQLENNIRAAQGRDIDRMTANRELLGKAAIANAKVAYRRFRQMFNGERFGRLRAAGARVQRPLWASTSTKNPAYPDTLYMDALIGPDTVNTVPPQTLIAFKDHGSAAPTLEYDIDNAHLILVKLAEVGVNLDFITRQLQEDGLEAFSESFRKLIEGVEGKVKLLKSGVVERQRVVIGQYQADVDTAITKLAHDKAVTRIWQRDASFWKSNLNADQAISERLGWLSIVSGGQIERARLDDLQSRAKAWKHIILLGMGGSSLAAEVMARILGSGAGYPTLIVLDSTDPEAVQLVERALNLDKTLFIVASKSGTTIETLSLQRYFYAKYSAGQAGAHFIAITDPGSPLEDLAKSLHFADLFLNPPDITGRDSALSYFGLVPAALIGIDLDRLLTAAEEMQAASEADVAANHHPGIWLGAVLATLGLKGRDKVSLITNPQLESFSAWAEQLIAESTGKERRGLVPVAGATIGNPHDYDDDRLFIYLTLDGDPANPDDEVRALQEAGHPIVTLTLRDKYDIGGEFYRWAFAAAVAGAILRINPFDEPNVIESKENTRRLLDETIQIGHLPQREAVFSEDSVSLYTDPTTAKLLSDLAAQRSYNASRLSGELAAFFGLARSGEYIALMAYLAPTPEYISVLENIRRQVRHAFKRAVTLGFGPRFLHSAGQLHKGGPNNGVFVQITVADQTDVPIPDAGYGFSTLKQAQAEGDLNALQQYGRRVVRLHISGAVNEGLMKVEEAIKAAEEKQK